MAKCPKKIRIKILPAFHPVRILIFILLLCGSIQSFAATRTSTTAGGDWSLGTTWVGGIAPAVGDAVIIATTTGNSVYLSANSTCIGVTINTNATLNGGAFTLTVNGPWENNGTFNDGTGTVNFGTTLAAINAGTGTANFENIVIASAATLVINTSVTVNGSLSYILPGTSNSVTLSGTNSLNVTGDINMVLPTNNSRSNTMAVGAGTLTVGGEFKMLAATTSSRANILSISTGTANLNGGFSTGTTAPTIATGSQITFTGAGVLNLGGSIGGGAPALTQSTGTVNFTGASAQGIWLETYYNVGVSSGTKTLLGNVTVSNVLTLSSGTLELNTFTLTLPGAGSPFVNAGGAFSAGVGLVTFSGTGQNVPGFTYYNLTFSTGAKTIENENTVTVSNNWVLGVATTMAGNASASVAGLLSGSGAITMDSGTLTIGGTVSHTGALTPGNGRVIYSGVAKNIKAVSYYNLEISDAGAKTMGGNFTVSNKLTINPGADFNGSTRTLSLSGGGSPLENNGTITLGTISYTGTVDQVVAGTAYNNLAFANAGIKTIATGTTVDVAGTWVNNSPTVFEGTASANVTGIFSGTAAIEMGSGTLTLLSTFTNNGTFDPGSGKVFYNGAGAQAVRLIAYYDLELGGAGAKTIGAGTPVTVARNFIVGSTTTMSTSAVVDIVGNISGSGALTVGTGTISLEGNWLHSGTFNPGTGAVLYDGETQSVADLSYYKLQISNTGIKSLVNNLTVSNILTINSGTLNLGTYTITLPFTGTPLVNNGTIAGTGTVLFSGSGAQTVAGTTYPNLEFSGAGAKTILSASTITVTNNWIVNSPVTMTGSQNADVTGNISGSGAITMGSGIISLEGSWTNNGTFTRGTGTVLFDGANQTIPAYAFNKLELSNAGTKTLAGNISLINVLTINSPAELNTLGFTVTLSFNGSPLVNTGTLSGTGKFIYSGTGTQSIDASSYYDLETGTGARTIADGLTINVAHDWTVTGTTTITGAANVNVGRDLAGTAGLTMGSGTITIGGAWTKTGAFTSGTGTVNYNGGTQTVASLNYYNLHITNAGVKTLAANTTVSKVLTINSGSLNLSSFNLTLSGDGIPLVNNSTLEATTSTVLFTSGLPTTIAEANYYNINGTGGPRTLASSGTIGIAGVFTPGAGPYDVTGSTVSFNGTAAQTIPAFTFYDLILSVAEAKSILTGSTVTVNTITIQDAASLNLADAAFLNITN